MSKPDGQGDLGGAGPDRVDRRHQRAAPGGAAVLDVGERDPGQAEVGDQGVRQAGPVAAAEGDLDVGPLEPGVAQRGLDGLEAELAPGELRLPAEPGQARPDDGDAGAHRVPSGRLRGEPRHRLGGDQRDLGVALQLGEVGAVQDGLHLDPFRQLDVADGERDEPALRHDVRR